MEKQNTKHLLFLFAGVILLLCGACGRPGIEKGSEEFIREELEWRSLRDQEMKEPASWLTIAGLFWLEEGESSFGTANSSAIQLPENSSPLTVGKFVRNQDEIKVMTKVDGLIKFNGQFITERVLKSDVSGQPDIIEINDLRLWIIKRAERFAVRLRDLNTPRFKNYTGLDFFPPDPRFKIEADFIAYPDPKTITVATMVGTESDMIAPGYLQFEIDGKHFELEAFEVGSDLKRFFIIFRDGTSGEETYGASRFMTVSKLENGKVDLNFNRAHNPPCAYTPYATCPLPPDKNELEIRITAGEKNYPGSSH
ncbi:DUF1684 domain-containing protein [Acidobacteriota bacterium]